MEEEQSPFLPEEIILHILSYLNPKEQARASVLSKAWISAWRTTPRLGFDDKYFAKYSNSYASFPLDQQQKKKFRNHVNDTLRRYRYHDIEEFTLRIAFGKKDFALVDRWIRMAIKKGVKVLNLGFFYYPFNTFILPQKIFEAKSLTELRVRNCMFPRRHNGKIMCTNIRVLDLTDVRINNKMLHWLIARCPLISALRINECNGMDKIKVANLCSLEELYICARREYLGTRDDKSLRIEVDAPSLKNMELRSNKTDLCAFLELHPSRNLVKLSMNRISISSSFFDELMDKFPHVEYLCINDCYGFKRMNLSSNTLKHACLFAIDFSNLLMEVQIDAPNITMFELVQVERIIDLSFTSVSRQMVSPINLELWYPLDDLWFRKLFKQVSSLKESKIFYNTTCCQNFDPKHIGDMIPSCVAVEVEELELAIVDLWSAFKPHSQKDLLDGLLSAYRPKTMVLPWRKNRSDGFVKNLSNILAERKNNNFCKSPHVNFWQNDLKEVEFKVYDFNKTEDKWEQEPMDWETVQNTSMTNEMRKKICFALEWGASSNSSMAHDADTLRLEELSLNA